MVRKFLRVRYIIIVARFAILEIRIVVEYDHTPILRALVTVRTLSRPVSFRGILRMAAGAVICPNMTELRILPGFSIVTVRALSHVVIHGGILCMTRIAIRVASVVKIYLGPVLGVMTA